MSSAAELRLVLITPNGFADADLARTRSTHAQLTALLRAQRPLAVKLQRRKAPRTRPLTQPPVR